MKKSNIANLTLFLLLISALCATLVSGVHSMTSPIVAKMQEDALQASYGEVYPDFDKVEQDKESRTQNGINAILLAEKAGQPAGVIYNVTTNGYAGPIDLLLAFDMQKAEITGVKILKQAETPGLGANAAKPEFTGQFAQKKAGKELLVVKAAPASDHEIQAVTASTITSKAVVNGINKAREHFITNYYKGALSK